MKKKISICYSCSDVMYHEHKTKIGAWLCGRWQAFLFSQLSRLTKRAADLRLRARLKVNNPKHKNEKSYSWNAGYHLKEAEKARKQVLYHEEKARLCKERSKKKEDV